jgi:hypothetical protein
MTGQSSEASMGKNSDNTESRNINAETEASVHEALFDEYTQIAASERQMGSDNLSTNDAQLKAAFSDKSFTNYLKTAGVSDMDGLVQSVPSTGLKDLYASYKTNEELKKMCADSGIKV